MMWYWNSQSFGVSSSHVWMWDLDHKKGWMPKNWCFQILMLEKTLESPSDCKEVNQSILKEITPKYSQKELMLQLKFQHIGQEPKVTLKDPDAGKDWREKGAAEDEMLRSYHWLSGHEFEQTPGDSGGERSLACCSPWSCRVGHDSVTEQQQQIEIVQ